MPISPRIADRLALVGGLSSAVVALAGVSTLVTGQARVVDFVTIGAGALGAIGTLASVLVRARARLSAAAADARKAPDR